MPHGLPVGQVHGWLADDAGRVLVQDREHEFKFLLPGGKVDLADRDWTHTLIRKRPRKARSQLRRTAFPTLGTRL